MSQASTTMPSPAPSAKKPSGRWRGRGRRTMTGGSALIAQGEPLVWLTASSLVTAVLMITGLVLLIVIQGGLTFWPTPVVKLMLDDGQTLMGEVTRTERLNQTMSDETMTSTDRAADLVDGAAVVASGRSVGERENVRRLLRTGNYDLTSTHFNWVSKSDVEAGSETLPEWAVVCERVEWGRFYGIPQKFTTSNQRPISEQEQKLASAVRFLDLNRFRIDGESDESLDDALKSLRDRLQEVRWKEANTFAKTVANGGKADSLQVVLPDETTRPIEGLSPEVEVQAVEQVFTGSEKAWQQFLKYHDAVRAAFRRRVKLEKWSIGEINRVVEKGRLAVREVELDTNLELLVPAQELAEARRQLLAIDEESQRGVEQVQAVLAVTAADSRLATAARKILTSLQTELTVAAEAPAATIKALEAQIEQLPHAGQAAIREYEKLQLDAAKEAAAITEQIAELNAEQDRYKLWMDTAGGVVHPLKLEDIVRAYPANRLNTVQKLGVYFSRWWEFLSDDPREANSAGGVFPAIWGTVVMTLIMSVMVAPFGVLAALYLREYAKVGLLVSIVRVSINNLAGVPSIVFGVFGLGFFCYIIGASIDEVLFAANLPNPTYGKGGLLWASLTLALLTLPVVIVATEEAISAVPKSMREGSFACGASKWQTIRRIVLPRAMPGIMTGMILAMARGAGEVAPLMLVGAVKLAPELPLDSVFPFLHGDRSFMHLGFDVYDIGFQSQNSEAAKPLGFTTTLLLITIVAVLNIVAIWVRSWLRRRYRSAQF